METKNEFIPVMPDTKEAYEAPVIHSVVVAVEKGFSLYPASPGDPDDEQSS